MSKTTRTLLIVDDSAEDRELYQRYLLREQDYSYTILEAELGQQGLALWKQHQPDVILLDYRLPDFDGLEFLAKLQRQQSLVPVIMVTGQGNEAIAVQAMKAGAQDYLVKEQITPERLQLAVHGAIVTVHFRTQLQQRIEREQVVMQITRKIHQSLELEEILQTAVTEVRQFLQTDRVLIFRLQTDGWGTVTTESVGEGWTPLLSTSLHDSCFNENYVELFRQGLVTIKSNIYDGSIAPCHVQLLASLQVRANLVVPIIVAERLWGMLIVHHCAAPRQWQPLEVELLKELAIQVGIALQQGKLYQQIQNELAERERVEAALRDSEEQFRQLAENIDAVFWIVEGERERVSYVSPAYKRLWGLNPQEVYENHQAWVNRIHPDDREAIAIAFQQKGAAGQFDEEYRIILADGSIRWVRDRCFPLKDERGKIYRFTGIAEDITNRKRTEIERARLLQSEQSAKAEAERANRIKDEFLAILSHELRSPLTPIFGWTKLLQTQKLNAAETTEALATIERSVELQIQLIDDLLDMTKILHGKLSMKMAPVALVPAIEAAIETVRTAAVAKSISFHSVLPDIGQVFGDAARLQQIVWNLLSNAIKFTPKGERVEVRLERVEAKSREQEAGGRGKQPSPSLPVPQSPSPNLSPQASSFAQITVSDTGKGISPDFLPYIFESFRQEDVSTTRKYGGLGLGLAIVRQLVEAHGGAIAADSLGEGLGSTFTVQLPLLNAKPQIEQTEELLQQQPDLMGIRVLAVDDEPETRKLLTVLFTQYGAEIITLASGTEVLTKLESFQPNVLVSDIGMSDVDGYTLIQQVRALPPEKGGQIPAIALTAYARVEDRQRALAVGFQNHISKPINLKKLVQAISDLTHRHSER